MVRNYVEDVDADGRSPNCSCSIGQRVRIAGISVWTAEESGITLVNELDGRPAGVPSGGSKRGWEPEKGNLDPAEEGGLP